LVIGVFSLVIAGSSLLGQDANLSISPDDIIIEEAAGGGGYDLYIRAKPGIGSVLITESTRDPSGQEDNYAYRAQEWNPVNGDEIRILDGEPISPERQLYSLIDSTPQENPVLGQAFHIFLPYILVYGSEDTRHGEVYVSEGTFLNLRAFALPYADYQGAFQENPFIFNYVQSAVQVTPPPVAPEKPEGSDYNPDTETAFRDLSQNGQMLYATDPDDLVEKIGDILGGETGQSLDLVICIDTTSSMTKWIDAVRKNLPPLVNDIAQNYQSFRVGLVLYRDYGDSYLNRVIAFTRDLNDFSYSLNGIAVAGGADIPEAVHEALYEGVSKFEWEAESRQIILIGDAPPHPAPKGSITEDMVMAAAAEQYIRISSIMLPNK
jgi:hypothetical protein